MRCYCGGLSASQSNYSNVSCSLKSQSPAECTAQSVLQKGKPRTALTFIIPIGYELLHVLAAERARGRGAAFPLPPLASPSPCSLSLRPSSLPDCTGLDPVPISPFDSPLFTIPSQFRRRRKRRNPLFISTNPFKRKQGLGRTVLNRLICPQASGSVTAPGHMTWKRKARRPFGSLSEWAGCQPGKKSKG
ncbi:hypothetical protein Q7C36_008592 [Tachysurus vachellii]|uniref:Uncharacterized protein n=1 Tax=Tachysurus vachellii TaxID=175792 RepID=A0AA88SSQ6_TACVA|nr:hypothetical protein Q7C36_008592 [Tachysurus vachellii]